MRSATLITLAVSLLSLFTPQIVAASYIAKDASSVVNPRGIDPLAAPRTSTDHLKARNHLKQVTRQQLLEREAKAQLLKARGPLAPSVPQQSPVPPTTVIVATGYRDDNVFPIGQDIPFDMVLFGKTQDTSTLEISTNGFLRFGTGTNHVNPGPVPNPVGNVALFPYARDLVLQYPSRALQYTFTDRMVRFEWQATPYGSADPTANIHFELEYLVDTPNRLYVRYLHDSNPAFLNGVGASIGVQAASDNIAYRYAYDNRDAADNILPAAQRAAPGRTLIIDTATGSFTLLG